MSIIETVDLAKLQGGDLNRIARYVIRTVQTIFVAYTMIAFLIGCSGDQFFDQLVAPNSYSGYIIVASATTAPTTGPGLVSLFKPDGTFVRVLDDLYQTAEVASGVGIFGNTVFALVDGTDRVDVINMATGVVSQALTPAGVTAAPFHQMTVDTVGNMYIAEFSTSQIEKIDNTYTRTGSPFIQSGGCVLTNPWGIAYIPSNNTIVVTNNGATRLSIYNATTGACASTSTNAAFGSSSAGIAYHPLTNKILTTRIGDSAIYASNIDGSSPVSAYLNLTRIQLPYTIAVDSAGYVYVGSSTQNTIEKMSFNGTTLSVIQSGPLIGPNVYTQRPTQIVVVP